MKQYYSKKIINHFLHPKNFGKLKGFDGKGDTKNLRCGDIMKLYIKVAKKKGKEVISSAKFETLGCGHALAVSDIICAMVKGKTIDKAKKLGYRDVIKKTGPIPDIKVHCCVLAETALKMAIKDYEKKKKSNSGNVRRSR